jgi:thioesterase domain-containing protein/acyl carrier protein
VLDGNLQPVPIGIPGELHVGGAGLARGYLNRPELTDERFIANPFSPVSGERLYKSGDLVRYLADRDLEYLGRIDHQVKIRGFRIELGEIEAALARHQAVRDVVVVAREDVPGDKRLVAYIVAEGGENPSVGALRDYLKQGLPEYMVPSVFVTVEKFALTANGKVDRRVLPAPEYTRPELEQAYAAPQTPAERALAEIWADVLGVKQVGVNDNFFDLGGNSLLAVRLFVRIRKWAAIDLPLATLFRSPTIRGLAEIFQAAPAQAPVAGEQICEIAAPDLHWSSLVPMQPHGTRPPFFVVHAVGGNVLNYLTLLPHLGSDQPVYGLQARGLDGVQPPYDSIEAMASDYIFEIRSVQPSGPYSLGGASFGGTVAFEIAQQLMQQGETVATLALFDTLGPGEHGYHYNRTSLKRRLSGIKGEALSKKTPLSLHFAKRIGRYFSNRTRTMRVNFFRMMQRPIPLELRDEYLFRSHNAILKQYQPRPYLGPIILFRGPAGDRWPYNDPELGWKDLARGGLKIYIIDAHHLDFMEPPELGIQLAQELGAAQQLDREPGFLNASAPSPQYGCARPPCLGVGAGS